MATIDVDGLERKLASLSGTASEERVDALIELAWEIAFSDPPRSLELTTEARQISDELGYRRGLAYCRRSDAYAHFLASELQQGLELCDEVVEEFRRLDDERGVASILDIRGFAYWRMGRYDAALQHSFESLKLHAQLEDRRGQAWALHNIGCIYMDVGDRDHAVDNLRKAEELFGEIDYKPGMLRILSALGEIYGNDGDFSTALEYHRESLDLARELKLPVFEAIAFREVGRAHQGLGQLDEARENFEQSLRIGSDTTESRAQALLSLGLLSGECGDDEQALRQLQEAQAVVAGIGALPTAYQIEKALSATCERLGNYEKALEHHRAFQEIKEEVFSEESTTRLRNLQINAETERAEGETEIHRLRYVELAQMQAQLVQSEKMASLGKLVAGLAHEVNTPIGVINSNTDLSQRALEKLRAELDNPELPEEFAASARRTVDILARTCEATADSGRKVAGLIASLRNFVALDRAEMQRADVNEGLRETVTLLKSQLTDKRIRLVTTLAELPKIECFPHELNQALMTLLSNAAEAIDEEGTIEVESALRDGAVCITIRDTGRGIPADKIEGIFDIGFSEKGATMRMNVGLANAYNSIQKHRGTIKVSSEVGQGTEFEIQLPI